MNNATHTPEPWKAELANEDKLGVVQFWMVTAGPDGDAVTQMPWIRQGILPNDEANARRIVAAVNYCEGVPTLEIESAPKHLQLRHLLAMIDNDLPIALAKLGDKS